MDATIPRKKPPITPESSSGHTANKKKSTKNSKAYEDFKQKYSKATKIDYVFYQCSRSASLGQYNVNDDSVSICFVLFI